MFMGKLLSIALAGVLVLCLAASPWASEDMDPLDSYDLQTQGTQSPWRVRGISFRGFEAISPSEAAEVVESKPAAALAVRLSDPYDSFKVAGDVRRLKVLFQEQGYFQAEVTATENRNEADHTLQLIFTAKQGPPTTVEKTTLVWSDDQARRLWEDDVKKLLALKPEQRFVLSTYEQTKQDIIKFFADQARPRNKVLGQVRVYSERNQAEILFKIDPGPRFLFGDSQVKGNHSLGRKFILDEATYTRGQPFSPSALKETQQALLNTGFFSSVTLRPLYKQAKDNQVPILLEVRERDPHSIQLGIGWGTEDQFRVRIQQVNRNVLGWNETLSVEGKLSSIYTGLVGTLKKPYLLNRRSTLVLRGGIEQRDTEAYINNRLFINPALEYVVDNQWSWYVGYNSERDRLRELKTKVPDPSYEKQTFFISSVPVGLIFDSRDSFLDATKGTYGRLEVENALKGIGSEVEFIRAEADLRHVLPLPWKNWYLAARAQAGVVWALPGTDRVPLIRRFFPGGADSVRGYPYQLLGPLDSSGKPLGGASMAVGSVEARFPIWQALGGVVFLDAGNAWERVEDTFGSLRYTTGFGLRYNTPVGPLRLDIGYQLNPPTGEPFDRYAVYLSVGQAF
ncbi:MAG: BamA/TamA family outer membrane protein [Desulfarculaceae bacterium]|nr:BamA/TamA family outer membrane protein [Desulfarculaceae bacterium]MCF8046497.1 BamA/TamA family outer membrane protein [Desulfarculaceae bacterium]MCF8064563.1 BamA/TamA family outer membrane protein [Desulfarculaceae bacterium]MCF8098575.1 BamA/TamA family outer membrane protein [Desulfarculaceae bacterium]MCF8122668.1 BamA/TamA family outer membrane protein [Desulfarculaceae bacterium]